MPRRSLRKIDQTLDYTGRFFTVEQLPKPWNLHSLFSDADLPLEVEVGSGKGHFIRSAAVENPEHNFLGIEVAHKYAAYCAAGLIRSGVHNAVMISGDAVQVFQDYFPDNFISMVHVYFPDPWWKTRHRKRRVMRMELISRIEKCLISGGTLRFWTDVEEYYLSTLKLMARDSILKGPREYMLIPDDRMMQEIKNGKPDIRYEYHTHFEKRTLLNGKPVYRADFIKE